MPLCNRAGAIVDTVAYKLSAISRLPNIAHLSVKGLDSGR